MPKAKRQNEQARLPISYSQPNNNILYVMMGVITLFLVFMSVKMFSLEKKINSGTAGGAPAAQQESPISVVNLKKMAKELKLNTEKFNKCLDSGEKKTLVDKDTTYGQSLGVQGTPGFFINGQFLAGAFPFSLFKEIIDKQINGTASSDCASYSTELQKYCSDPANKAFDPTTKEVDVKNMVAAGAKNGKVTIVEFSDFECPYCIRAYPTVKQILNEYKNDVTLYFKNFPLVQIHPNAAKTAEASLCAADQGKFWEFHDKVFETEAK
ncbi:MAG: DSBA-like protein thioredoxin domain-containing protein [Candidatus Levybacteria bacterium GW2011_GWA2_37_36]|uniref:DSBA-like protein thioredoxin domain-containing protein n=1 Tax=Candidatus Roizmanbacteria bacterium GW2011_GWC2_34_23 TaxID=1618484 RepID=A0A0G0E648_9BACT|nr:MAG: DSBA-like protein thioredoxin domain-containing protein [Candidatus Roizmanbacteria bacterium GW2011_GWC2_34_23]KKQ31636.1 MAG: DSBA-like protein thioredoxin domain-containing protein [Candidatus Levybacteria bacterium GW2011_GWA2_37_36]